MEFPAARDRLLLTDHYGMNLSVPLPQSLLWTQDNILECAALSAGRHNWYLALGLSKETGHFYVFHFLYQG
jgi:hypothetical protein